MSEKCIKACIKDVRIPFFTPVSSLLPDSGHDDLDWKIVAQVSYFRWGQLEMGCGPGVRFQAGFATRVIVKFLSAPGLNFQWFDSTWCPGHWIWTLLWVSLGSYSLVALEVVGCRVIDIAPLCHLLLMSNLVSLTHTCKETLPLWTDTQKMFSSV